MNFFYVDTNTIQTLNAINRNFYRVTAADFDQTRGQAWAGWQALPPHMGMPHRVLDVGCGNGRFGAFLAAHYLYPIHYHGMDNSTELLAFAAESLRDLPTLTVALETRDIVEHPPHAGEYDLIVLFGVIHHVPGADRRLALMRALAERLSADGVLVFAAWRFMELERLARRVVAWDQSLAGHVEKGDYLLDWRRGANALRYCHYVDDDEHQALIAATGLHEVISYRADGENGQLNRYSVLKRATASQSAGS